MLMEKQQNINVCNDIEYSCSSLCKNNTCYNNHSVLTNLRNSFEVRKGAVVADHEQSKGLKCERYDKRTSSPILNCGKSKKIKKNSLESSKFMTNSDKSPDLSQTTKNSKLKTNHDSDFIFSKDSSPNIKSKLQKSRERKIEPQKSIFHHVNGGIEHFNVKRPTEIKNVKRLDSSLSQLKDLSGDNCIIDVKTKANQCNKNYDLQEIKTSNCQSKLDNNIEENCSTCKKSNSNSPDLCLNKNVGKNKLNSSRRIVRKNLFSDFKEQKSPVKLKLSPIKDALQDFVDFMGIVDDNDQRSFATILCSGTNKDCKNLNDAEDLYHKNSLFKPCDCEIFNNLSDNFKLTSNRSQSSTINMNSHDIERREKSTNVEEGRFFKHTQCVPQSDMISKKKLRALRRHAVRNKEICKKYGILPVMLRRCKCKCSDKKETICSDSVGECYNSEGSQFKHNNLLVSHRDFNVEDDKKINQSVVVSKNDIIYDKMPKDCHNYFDSDEECYIISEVLSPPCKENCKVKEKSMTCVNTNSGCSKVWSFDKDRFESVFKLSSINEKYKAGCTINDSLSSKQILIPISERYKELSDVMKSSCQTEFKISDSSDSSPELKQSVSKMNLRNSCQSKSKRVKKKNILTPVLDVKICSQKSSSLKQSLSVLHKSNIKNNLASGNFSKKENLCRDENFGETGENFNKVLNLEIFKNSNCDSVKITEKCSVPTVNKAVNLDDLKTKELTCISPQLRDSCNDHSDELKMYETEEKCNYGKNILVEGNSLLKENTPDCSQSSEIVIESISSQSNAGNNKTVYEIEFSDASSLPSEPKTPPCKVNQKYHRDVNIIDSSSKKRKKTYPEGSLVSRLCSVRNRYESDANFLHYKLTKKNTEFIEVDLPVFMIKRIFETYSKALITCLPLQDAEPSNTDESFNSLSLRKELLILADSTMFTTKKVFTGIHFKIHPPWQVLDDPENDFTMLLNSSCLEVLTKSSTSSLLSQYLCDNKTCSMVAAEYKCSCQEGFLANPDCQYKFSDELFAELFCSLHSKGENSDLAVPPKKPTLYFKENHLKGTIGNARAFQFFYPVNSFIVSVVSAANEKFDLLKLGNLFIVIKDSVEEFCIVVLITTSDIEKWNSGTDNMSNTEGFYEISGLQFTHRIPLERCKTILKHQLEVHQVQQNYIYCLSPASDKWNVVKR